MKLWMCPNCEMRIRAPERMDRDDVRLYCLNCSEGAGKLVKRVCPSAQNEQKKRAERRAESKAKRAKQAHKRKLERLVAVLEKNRLPEPQEPAPVTKRIRVVKVNRNFDLEDS